ncbi:TetR/AcrR family transcriptional regulator [Halomicronema sp. CCY15110]|uniref:TetR/AcrR family transcriptional regulator n=1 Tax=Halomicronema sp. CCY15110 TaxID=2767773 RepID=UPI00194EFF9B|nr:TetR/AcrR family transcriptional regulator [Halomicronema sp. CCY15110]
MVAYYSPVATGLANDTETKILQAAQQLFARQGYGGTTTRDLAQAAGVAEGTLFRHFESKKAILLKVASDGWTELLTDLLTDLSEMANYKAIDQVMQHRLNDIPRNADLMRVCFMEAQLHLELQGPVQGEMLAKMVDVTEAFFQTAIDRGIYRPLNPRVLAQIFLGMFAIAGFTHSTLDTPASTSEQVQAFARGLSDVFLNGVLAERDCLTDAQPVLDQSGRA